MQYQAKTGALICRHESVKAAAESVKGRANRIYDAIASGKPAYGSLWQYWESAENASTKEQKQILLNRLIAYRKKHGLGCLKNLRRPGLTEDEIREMLERAPFQLDKWNKLRQALDKAEKNS